MICKFDTLSLYVNDVISEEDYNMIEKCMDSYWLRIENAVKEFDLKQLKPICKIYDLADTDKFMWID